MLRSLLSLDPARRGTFGGVLRLPHFSSRPVLAPDHLLPLPADILARKKVERPSKKRRMVESAEGPGMGGLAKKLFFLGDAHH